MNNFTTTVDQNFDDEEVFEDSFLARFENASFREAAPGLNVANTSALNVSALCCDEEISGYDKLAGQNWIYPTNYPVRDYQFNIIKAAIIKNTLVSLPTGLGKTFIAAVIMYNFYRWYPIGKIVFTAPTRPLVAQQIDACYNIIAIPPNDTIEMTGHMQVTTRKAHWQTKRVFFATPQVIYNDIKSGICPADKIRCLVIDEAHRARGNYAYCQIVSTLNDMGCKTYRLLALSATPGSKVEDVINVVKSLQIAHLELRTEGCIDVAPYSHARKINTVVVDLGPELSHLRVQYVDILDSYARRLKQFNILPQNLGNLSKGRIVMLYKEFQTKERSARHPQHNYIMKDFTLLIALYHGLELLVKHGSRVFLNFFDEHPEKSWIQADDRLTALLERLRDDLGTNPMSLDRSILPDGTVPEMPQDLCFGHPKFYKLKEIMLEHFTNAKKTGQDTRAIVFCEYRESVNLVHCLLLQCRPLIVPQMFVGQGASGKDGKTVVSQKQQLRVMRSFREGACNALVATCVAEEGLDVGSVDLIICFDISTRSPIRLVQRCGRTGRERGGQVFILVTEGREHQTLMDCIRQKDGLNKKIHQSRDVQNSLYKSNPRMIPHDFTPQCQKMYITVEKRTDGKDKSSAKKSKKPQKDLRSLFLGRASSSGSSSSNNLEGSLNELITEMEFKEIYPNGYKGREFFEQPKEYWNMNKADFIQHSKTVEKPKLSTWLEWQRIPQKSVKVGHSKDTDMLTKLLDYSDAKRFEMPVSTQNPTFTTQDLLTQKVSMASPVKTKAKPKKAKVISKSPIKKDGDIRALFSSVTKSTRNYTKLINDLGIPNDGSIPTKLINLLVDLSIDNSNYKKDCYICSNICDCSKLRNVKKEVQCKEVFPFLFDLKLPELDLIDEMDAETINKYAKKNDLARHIDEKIVGVKDEKISNFNLELDFEPADFCSDDLQTADKVDKNDENNFDIGEIDDIFADSSPEEAVATVKLEEVDLKKEEKPKDVLNFFNLDSIDDIFADDDDMIEEKLKTPEKKTEPKTIAKITTPENNEFQDTIEFVPSPSILSGRLKSNVSMTTSPILGTQVRKFQLSTKKSRSHSTPVHSAARKQLQLQNENNNHLALTPDNRNCTAITDTSKSMLSVTQIIDMINKTGDKSINTSKKLQTKLEGDVNYDDDRSTSPIILTQADIKHISNNSNNPGVTLSQKNAKYKSLIVLDSDSESDTTQEYNIEFANENVDIPTTSKRKVNSESPIMPVQSPYFNKRQKLDNKKSLTLQEKVLAALTNSQKKTNPNSDININFAFTNHKTSPEKENISPNKYCGFEKADEKECMKRNNLSMLQMFRRDSKVKSPKSKFSAILESSVKTPQKRKLTFDSDDDFEVANKYSVEDQKSSPSNDKHELINHKVRKKKKPKLNSFVELEAEISDDGESGDELSDESVGSIIDFICDENETIHEDMQAHYLRSIKSPVKGVFKIPEMPKKYKNLDIFSQNVEEDAYEMDSFCVDADIGLTQANELSELEIAEIVLEKNRKSKKKKINAISDNGDGSPIVLRRKHAKRLIESDSDDSS